MQVNKSKKLGQIGIVILPIFLLTIILTVSTQWAQAQGGSSGANNLVMNGNFEEGFYPVPELGFEPPDVGQVPLQWNWFKSNTFGKFTIDNQEGFGLVCPGDADNGFASLNALSLQMQSTDQQDARLGVYQTVDVVKGQKYLFVITGTIQSMQGSPEKSDDSHVVEVVFDHSGGTDWRAIPHEKWTQLPWGEYLLEFKTSGPDDPDIAKIENYATIVEAQSDKMTIFIAAWRRWADWRSVRYTLDCISLVPASNTTVATVTEPDNVVSNPSLRANNVVQEASVAVTSQTNEETTPAQSPAIIPDSGGVLEEDSNALLTMAVSVIIIVGLVGAGLWNIRRKGKTS